jgi:tRNA(Arg) A34 adenosine deaminase TadA
MTQRQDITAIIYDKRGRVLSIGKNNYLKTHPLQAKYANRSGEFHKIWLHAEIHAITRCKDIQLAHRIVVFRYNRKGEPAMSKPCATCMAALAHTPIKVVEHT